MGVISSSLFNGQGLEETTIIVCYYSDWSIAKISYIIILSNLCLCDLNQSMLLSLASNALQDSDSMSSRSKNKTREGSEKNQGTDAQKNESKNKTDLHAEHAAQNEGIEIGSECEFRRVKDGSPVKVELNPDFAIFPGDNARAIGILYSVVNASLIPYDADEPVTVPLVPGSLLEVDGQWHVLVLGEEKATIGKNDAGSFEVKT